MTMSAVSSNPAQKINGNLIFGLSASANASNTLQTNKKSLAQNQNLSKQQLQKIENSSSTAATSTFAGNKLLSTQQYQRRSIHQAQQQEHNNIAKTAATNSTNNTQQQPNQLQTVATIHQPASSQANTQHSGSSGAQINSATTGNFEHANTRRSFHQLPVSKSSHSLKAPAHSIPPRYQPPPQPNTTNQQQVAGGILKNLNNQRVHNTANKCSPSYPATSYFTDSSAIPNFKYPPEIPQLSTVYIPDSLKQSSNIARYPQQRQTSQTQLQHRLRTSALLNNPTHHQNLETQQHQQDMLKFVRKTDQDHPSPNGSSANGSGAGGVVSNNAGCITNSSGGRLSTEQNRQLQSLINEMRSLKEQNQRLMDDNQELRDLCCFLDDDRQKGRKLAREWQRFGRYTASVMRQEVAAYQNKLRQLDDKQQELITDNLELKELCLYLDEERAHIAANSLCANCGASTRNALRDDGDGSSSSTNNDENLTVLRNYDRQLPDIHLRSSLQDQTLQYVRSLERRIQQLEEERVTNNNNSNNNNNNNNNVNNKNNNNINHDNNNNNNNNTIINNNNNKSSSAKPPPISSSNNLINHHHQTHMSTSKSIVPPAPSSSASASQKHLQQTASNALNALSDSLADPISGRPEAVVRALQVLEVREQLERDRLGNLSGCAIDQMDDGEKALVREMCNVVWRKLEGSPGGTCSSVPATLEPL